MIKKILTGLVVMFFWAATTKGVLAGAHYTLTPTSGNYQSGATFSVVLGINSGTDKIIAGDLVMTFDSSKLNIASVEKMSSTAFDFYFDSTTPKVNNTDGKFEMTLAPNSSTIYDGVVASGDLIKINFKAVGGGTANVSFTCQSGVNTDTNIVNTSSTDVVDCSTNQSGSYVIAGAEVTAKPTSTSTVLPETGIVSSTVGLTILGIVGVGIGMLLKIL